MCAWTKELDLQLVRLLREHYATQGGVWEASKGRNIDWALLLERGAWPASFTSATLSLRWADTYRRWQPPGGVARDKGNRALVINFDTLGALVAEHYETRNGLVTHKRKDYGRGGLTPSFNVYRDDEAGPMLPPLPLRASASPQVSSERAHKVARAEPERALPAPEAPPSQDPEDRLVADWLAVAAAAERQGRWTVHVTLPTSVEEMELDALLAFFNAGAALALDDRTDLAHALLPQACAMQLLFSHQVQDAEVDAVIAQHKDALYISLAEDRVHVVEILASPAPAPPQVRVWTLQPRNADDSLALALPPSVLSLCRGAHAALLFSSAGECDALLLWLIAKISAAHAARGSHHAPPAEDLGAAWPGMPVAPRALLSLLIQRRRLSLCLTPGPPALDASHGSLVEALLSLGVAVPAWLQRMWRATPDTQQARDDLLEGIAQSTQTPLQLAVLPLDAQQAQRSGHTFHWDRSKTLCLLGERAGSFAAILRLYVNANDVCFAASPIPEVLHHFRLDGCNAPLSPAPPQGPRISELRLPPHASRLDFRFYIDSDYVRIAVMLRRVRLVHSDSEERPGRAAPASDSPAPHTQCATAPAHSMLLTTPMVADAALASSCDVSAAADAAMAPPPPTESNTAAHAPDVALDELLESLALRRRPVPCGALCVVRALLAALGHPTSVLSLAMRVWASARADQFRSEALTAAQQRALVAMQYAPAEVITADAPGTDVAAFWGACHAWAAAALGYAVIVVDADARQATLYSRTGECTAAVIPLAELPRRLQAPEPAVVLVQHGPPHAPHLDGAYFASARSAEAREAHAAPVAVVAAECDAPDGGGAQTLDSFLDFGEQLACV